jgi:membrane-associated phospholipid phosphatase
MICCFPAHAQVHAEPDRLGDALQYAVPLAAAALSWVHQDTPGLQQLGATLLLSQTTTEVLKHAANSPRPDGTGRGFPSGHASLAFASAGYVRQRYGWGESAPFYALASSMAWTRVHTHHHFTKDVIGGALVGEASSILVARWMGPRQSAAVSYGTQGVWVSYTQEF